MNSELLNKAKEAKTPEELIKLAKEIGSQEMSAEEAKAYFDVLHKSGELADDELEQAAGGCASFNSDGTRVVTKGNLCAIRHENKNAWQCNKCYCHTDNCNCFPEPNPVQDNVGYVTVPTKYNCGTCLYCKGNSNGLGYSCTHWDLCKH